MWPFSKRTGEAQVETFTPANASQLIGYLDDPFHSDEEKKDVSWRYLVLSGADASHKIVADFEEAFPHLKPYTDRYRSERTDLSLTDNALLVNIQLSNAEGFEYATRKRIEAIIRFFGIQDTDVRELVIAHVLRNQVWVTDGWRIYKYAIEAEPVRKPKLEELLKLRDRMLSAKSSPGDAEFRKAMRETQKLITGFSE